MATLALVYIYIYIYLPQEHEDGQNDPGRSSVVEHRVDASRKLVLHRPSQHVVDPLQSAVENYTTSRV